MLSFHHEGGAKRSSPSRSRVFLFKEVVWCPPAGGRGMHPPFLFFLKKRNGPCTVQRETAWGLKLDRFGSSLGQNGGRARRCPRKLRVPYRVRRTPAEQRWFFPAFGGLRVAFGGGYRKAPASLSALSAALAVPGWKGARVNQRFPRLICRRQIKKFQSFLSGHAPDKNTSTQPPWAAFTSDRRHWWWGG